MARTAEHIAARRNDPELQRHIAEQQVRTTARNAAHRARQLAENEARKPQNFVHPSGLEGKNIGFIVLTRHGTFKSFIGKVLSSDDSDDCVVYVTATAKEACVELKEARENITVKANVHHAFLNPIKPGGDMGFWLNEMIRAEKADG